MSFWTERNLLACLILSELCDMVRFYALDLSMLSLYLRLLPQGLEQAFSGLCLLTIPTFVCKQYGFQLVVLVYSKFTTDA